MQEGIVVRIAFTGAQGTGKTTLVEAFKHSGLFDDYDYFGNVTRKLKARGFKINEAGSDETQLALIDIHEDNLKSDCFFTDRCIIDCYVYGTYQYEKGLVSKETEDKMHTALLELVPRYDLIFYLTPEFDLVDDGVRSTNIDFREDICKIFDNTIFKVLKNSSNIVRLSGSVSERFKEALEVIESVKSKP